MCRSLQGMWLISEGCGESSEEGPWSSIMTLGYDPALGRYVGTFVGSMMSNVWMYQGKLDASGKRLVLDTTGPSFDGSGPCNYRDAIEPVDADTWLLNSEMQNDDGSWTQFMHGKHSRASE